MANNQPVNLGRLRPNDTQPQSYADAIRRGERSFSVASSFLDSVHYNPTRKEMTFRFPSGFTITFAQFREDLLESFLAAPSKGRWYHKHIKVGYNSDGSWIYSLPVVSQSGKGVATKKE